MKKTIVVTEETKKKLDERKIHPRETYNEVLLRLLNSDKNDD